MNKIKFKGMPAKLLGNVDLKAKQLNIKAIDQTGEVVSIAQLGQRIKVISTFPKLNTAICDNQTKTLAKLAHKYPNVSFVSITMDNVKTIAKWCLAHSLHNVAIWSDRIDQEFSKATHLLIPKLKMLARGFIILDQTNKVINYFYKEEITDEPMFGALEAALLELLNKS